MWDYFHYKDEDKLLLQKIMCTNCSKAKKKKELLSHNINIIKYTKILKWYLQFLKEIDYIVCME